MDMEMDRTGPHGAHFFTAEIKYELALRAIFKHNDAQPDNRTRWYIDNFLLWDVTDCHEGNVRDWFQRVRPEIDAHHEKHGLVPTHNDLPNKTKSIVRCIDFPEVVLPEWRRRRRRRR